MKCPYCGYSDDVNIVGVPTVTRVLNLGPMLGFGIISLIKATALVATFASTHKVIYKCDRCKKYFIA